MKNKKDSKINHISNELMENFYIFDENFNGFLRTNQDKVLQWTED